MDSEVKDECENDEISVDSPTTNKNNLKEGVKNLHIVNKDEDEKMEVDCDKNSSSDKLSENNNDVKNENLTKENQNNNKETNCEKTASNHKQNISSEKEVIENSVNSEESSSKVSSEELGSENDKNKESTKITEPEVKPSENHNEINNNPPDESEKPMDVDISDKDETNEKTSKLSSETSEKDARPPDKTSNNFSEINKDDKKSDEITDKTDSSSENKSKDEVSSEKGNTEDSKETEKPTPESKVENKKESSKKEGEEKEEKSSKKKKNKTCEECGAKKGLKFQVLFKGKTRFLCSDTCFTNFKEKQKQAKSTSESSSVPPTASEETSVKCICQKDVAATQGYYPVIGEPKPLCSEECMKKYVADNIPIKSCSQCQKVIENPQNPDVLTWETMVFCNEDCLGKYQSFLGSHCTCCQSPVPQASLGKYSVCFGADIRQFCSCSCLDDFKKNLKVCSFCQTDLSAGIDSFLAPVGDKGQFKDFCSQNCMERYEVMNNITKSAPQTQTCSHCKKQGTFKIQVKRGNDTSSLCSDLCVAGFRCSNKIKERMCDTCFNFFFSNSDKEFSFKFDGNFKQFCSKACMTLFVLSHRKIVACASCKVKKYNFDMIEKTDANNQVQIFCSLNCLSLFRVSVNATSGKSVRCDNCSKTQPAQYHLTMSDGSVRNFCNYNCVILFQKQYTNVCTLTTASSTRQTTAPTSTTKTVASGSSPVISNVVSLAAAGPRSVAPTLIKVPARPQMQPVAFIGSKPTSTVTTTTMGTVTNSSGQQVVREVIVKPPPPKSQKNKSVACKPIMQNKGVNVKPQPCHKAVQTDDSPRPILLPIPVPIYIPTPMHMFSRPVPCPVPFPVPIPVPIMVPVSKDSSNQDQMPPNSISRNFFMMSDKISDGSTNRKDCTKDNHDQEPDRNMKTGDLDSPNSEEYNDANNEYDDDEYVFKDGKNHHHGKRHSSHHKNKGHKKHKGEDSIIEETVQQTPAATEENQNPVQNDHAEPVPRLKVP